MEGTAADWLALPQPSFFASSGGQWRPRSARVVASMSALDGEVARLQGELAEWGIPAGDDSRIELMDARASTSPGADETPGGAAAPGEALPGGALPGGALPGEAFEIEVYGDIRVRSSSAAGAFRATRQLLHNLRAQGFVPCGRVASAPAVAERGIHLDAARKHYPADWIIRLLHAAADVGVNVFQWHFSENEGFRLASARFPEIVSDEHITTDEAQQIGETARTLHIDVVPSLDMPGHLGWVLRQHPELSLPAPDDPETLVPAGTALDITRPEAADFARALIDDLAAHFPHSTRWNLGGDEFVDFARMNQHPALADAARARFGVEASGFDLLTGFVNDMAAHLRTRGFTTRVWNDGMLRSSLSLEPSVELTWWTNWHADMRPVTDAAGRAVVNFHDSLLYYVLGEKAGYAYPTAERIWAADWHPGRFPDLPGGVRQEIPLPYPALLRGCSFSIWSDDADAQTVDEVADGVRRPLAAMAERAWNGGSRLSMSQFETLMSASGA